MALGDVFRRDDGADAFADEEEVGVSGEVDGGELGCGLVVALDGGLEDQFAVALDFLREVGELDVEEVVACGGEKLSGVVEERAVFGIAHAGDDDGEFLCAHDSAPFIFSSRRSAMVSRELGMSSQ